jgi:hypothetical protein
LIGPSWDSEAIAAQSAPRTTRARLLAFAVGATLAVAVSAEISLAEDGIGQAAATSLAVESDEADAARGPSRRSVVPEPERRQVAMMLIPVLDHCRRADLLLRDLCEKKGYATRTLPELLQPICSNLPDLQMAIEHAEADYRRIFSAEDVDDALALSGESFERQFAGPLRHKFTGFDVEMLQRIVQERCDDVTNPGSIRRLQSRFGTH